MESVVLRLPPRLCDQLAAIRLSPETLIKRQLRLITGPAMQTAEDIGEMLGPNALYMRLGDAGEPVMVLQTIGTDYEVGVKLITAGKLLRRKAQRRGG
jgi:hypothetical protein